MNNTRISRIVNRIFVAVIIVAAVGAIAWAYASDRGEAGGRYVSPTTFAMDTSLSITIDNRGKAAEADAAAAIERAKEIEACSTMFDDSSDVFMINENAGKAPVKVSADTLYLVRTAIEYGEMTDGAFDITITPAVRLWGFYDKEYRVPGEDELAGVLPLIDYRMITVDDTAQTVFLEKEGMGIDLGGIAKGFAVREMYNLLRSRGVESALINFGGSIGALGRRGDGKRWVVGIRHPRDESDLAGTIEAENIFINSSGDYERFFMVGERRYSHILDPSTGGQPSTEIIETTVVGPDAMIADILSKIPFLHGTDPGLMEIASIPGYGALTIDKTGKVMTTEGFTDAYNLVVNMTI